ncbi:MAG: LysM peptidoglycan-binding domain-containing protein [Candidatus Levybacteria bacterium]|nr:LysM peptidoglycan-binding domain-containing protein [Candidatus Levybacteria bacterium]
MAKRKIKKEVLKENLKKEEKTGIFSKIKFTESYTSLILGALVVLIVGILFFSITRLNRNMQTSSVKDEPAVSSENDSQTSSTYTVKAGDDLWTISENVYKDGYQWTEIAKANKLENPEIIHSGNKLIIPKVTPKKIAVVTPTITPTPEKEIKNISITGNTYVIKTGDTLWDISIRAYGDGYKWPEVARINNLENPDLIYPGNSLKIPR